MVATAASPPPTADKLRVEGVLLPTTTCGRSYYHAQARSAEAKGRGVKGHAIPKQRVNQGTPIATNSLPHAHRCMTDPIWNASGGPVLPSWH